MPGDSTAAASTAADDDAANDADEAASTSTSAKPTSSGTSSASSTASVSDALVDLSAVLLARSFARNRIGGPKRSSTDGVTLSCGHVYTRTFLQATIDEYERARGNDERGEGTDPALSEDTTETKNTGESAANARRVGSGADAPSDPRDGRSLLVALIAITLPAFTAVVLMSALTFAFAFVTS